MPSIRDLFYLRAGSTGGRDPSEADVLVIPPMDSERDAMPWTVGVWIGDTGVRGQPGRRERARHGLPRARWMRSALEETADARSTRTAACAGRSLPDLRLLLGSVDGIPPADTNWTVRSFARPERCPAGGQRDQPGGGCVFAGRRPSRDRRPTAGDTARKGARSFLRAGTPSAPPLVNAPPDAVVSS